MIAVTPPTVPAWDPTAATPSAISHAKHELHGEKRSEFVDGRIFGYADQRGAKLAVGKERADRDDGRSQRHHSERRRREQVREQQCADERGHLSGGLTGRQQHRADCASIAYVRRALGPRRLLYPRALHREQSCGATLAIYELVRSRSCAAY
jgi:hypothetical protein